LPRIATVAIECFFLTINKKLKVKSNFGQFPFQKVAQSKEQLSLKLHEYNKL
jgi:hypothetical protein